MPKNYKIIILAVVVILFATAVGCFGYFSLRTIGKSQQAKINSFEACAQAGNPIMESYPEQCRTKDGRLFVRELSEAERKNLLPPTKNCKNLCGDGVCMEVVCTAIGCPCAETAQSCPQDCEPQAGGLANPASVNCGKLRGRVDIRTDETGGQVGYCVFENGQECEEWALMRGECALEQDSRVGILEGKVTVGPICPVERADVPCPVPPEAYTSREVIIYRTDGATEVARQNFDKDGGYNFMLAPGVYVINTPRQGPGGSKDLPQTVIIKGGETLILNFDIDTGIR